MAQSRAPKMSSAAMSLLLSAILCAVVSSGAILEPRQMGPPPGAYMDMGPPPPSAPQGGPGGPGGQGGPYPFPLKDPGFSVTNGFEGFMVPNSWGGWGGLLPFGLEGLLMAGGVVLVVLVFLLVLGALVMPFDWLHLFGKKMDHKDSEGARAFDSQSFLELTTNVLDAIDKYSSAADRKSQ